MDTRWKKWKAGISLISFLLGGVLLLVSIPLGAIGIANWSRVTDAFQSDYQNTREFQRTMSSSLNGLLGIAENSGLKNDYTGAIGDPNILYEVWVDEKLVYRSDPTVSLGNYSKEGYNFYLLFDGKKVTVTKDGKELDIYNGYYESGQGWDVPGFVNYPVRSENDKHVRVFLAAPTVPMLYPDAMTNTLYRMKLEAAQTRQLVLWLCAIPVAGVVLFGLYILWRKDKKRADMAIAGVTGRIWAEFKPLFFLLLLLFGGGWIRFGWMYGSLWNTLTPLLLTLPPLLLYLAINDLRYNGWRKIIHQSLCGTVARAWRCEELKRPVERRLQRRAVAIFVAMTPFMLWSMLWGYFHLFTWAVHTTDRQGLFIAIAQALLGLFLLLAQICFLRRGMADAHELALLTDQIEALKSGDFSAPAVLPADADLRAAAESLAGLRQGMENAITERMRSERMKVELITNVSHDLKTPLTSVVSYAELLSREEGLPDHVKDYITILNDKAQRLKTMVGDVFEVSKAASGALPLKVERLDLGKLLRQTLADMEGAIGESGRNLVTAIPEEPVTISADGDRLYRVFQNILQNALQYSLEGTRIYLTLTPQDGSAIVILKNISRDPLPLGLDLTERFVRGDEMRSDGGSGLGLAIASSFTSACGGRFGVYTDADLFTAEVVLPMVGE